MTFDIVANGILNVTARDKATGKELRVTITVSTNLSKKDIGRMIAGASIHQAVDQERRELVEARNTADSTVNRAEKILCDLGMQVPGDLRGDVERRASDYARLPLGGI